MANHIPPRELADQLVGACGDIERELGRRLGPNWRPPKRLRDGLRTRATELRERKDPQVIRYFNQIVAFAALRNAIVHDGYRNGNPIAVPFPETAQAAMNLARELLAPSSIQHYISKPVTVQTDEEIARPLATMVERDLSQLPAFSGNAYQGLLTTNAIARWVGAHLEDKIMQLDVQVSEVLAHAERHERAEFIPKDFLALAAINRLTSPESAPVALLITQNGKPTEGLIGVLTIADVPRMHRDIDVPMP